MMLLKPIGFFKSPQTEAYHAGRQPDHLGEAGVIKLESGHNYEQALQDLIGCSHIWILFGFHHNDSWKPLVQTPRSDRKIGVFATRAPYRPNPIGMSLVKLIDIQNLNVFVGENDLLNGSPVYDIKPFHPEHDVAPDAHIEWMQTSLVPKHQITFSPMAEAQIDFLEAQGLREIRPFILRQLEYDPTNHEKKRVESNGHYWTLAYRTWRVDFSVAENTVGIIALHSGYSEADLTSEDDKYNDKKLHRLFAKEF